ncbi:MAG: DUF6048 family protein [Bacteroidota bacterium]
MKNISGYISKAALLFALTVVSGPSLKAQDTLRTYGPRIGLDLARFAYYFTKPAEIGAELSADFEVYKNIYPVVELGFSTMSESTDLFDYASGGSYGRLGLDYNVLPMKDRSVHHTFTVGARYGISLFTHRTENMFIQNAYWGDLTLDSYESTLRGQWIELVGGMKAEVASNLFLGWSLRYKILLNQDMDQTVTPQLIPGYGNGTNNRGFGLTYSIFYKIPLLKR